MQARLGRKSKETPALKSGREEAQHVLDWKRDQAVFVTPKSPLSSRSKDICLINTCKGSYVKKICDYSWCFPGFNNIILLTERSEAEESKGSFPSSSFIYPLKIFSKLLFPQGIFTSVTFSLWEIVHLQVLPWQHSHSYKNMSPTQHIQTIIIYLTSDRPVANSQCFGETQENKPCRQMWISLFIQSISISFCLFLNVWISFWVDHTPFIHAKLAFFSQVMHVENILFVSCPS